MARRTFEIAVEDRGQDVASLSLCKKWTSGSGLRGEQSTSIYIERSISSPECEAPVVFRHDLELTCAQYGGTRLWACLLLGRVWVQGASPVHTITDTVSLMSVRAAHLGASVRKMRACEGAGWISYHDAAAWKLAQQHWDIKISLMVWSEDAREGLKLADPFAS